jgi:hypothetical protein
VTKFGGVAVLVVLALALTPLEAAASPLPYYGYGFASDYYLFGYDLSDVTGSNPVIPVFVPSAPPQTLSCHRSRQIFTVRSESGGTSDITITRC